VYQHRPDPATGDGATDAFLELLGGPLDAPRPAFRAGTLQRLLDLPPLSGLVTFELPFVGRVFIRRTPAILAATAVAALVASALLWRAAEPGPTSQPASDGAAVEVGSTSPGGPGGGGDARRADEGDAAREADPVVPPVPDWPDPPRPPVLSSAGSAPLSGRTDGGADTDDAGISKDAGIAPGRDGGIGGVGMDEPASPSPSPSAAEDGSPEDRPSSPGSAPRPGAGEAPERPRPPGGELSVPTLPATPTAAPTPAGRPTDPPLPSPEPTATAEPPDAPPTASAAPEDPDHPRAP